jgi:hypothetical protein
MGGILSESKHSETFGRVTKLRRVAEFHLYTTPIHEDEEINHCDSRPTWTSRHQCYRV